MGDGGGSLIGCPTLFPRHGRQAEARAHGVGGHRLVQDVHDRTDRSTPISVRDAKAAGLSIGMGASPLRDGRSNDQRDGRDKEDDRQFDGHSSARC
jgi:hypothetical protein